MISRLRSAFTLVLIGAAVGLAGCSQPETRTFDGIAEAEYIRVAASLAGSLASLNVSRGTRVREGEQLFALDARVESLARREALARVRQAQEDLEAARGHADKDALRAAQAAVSSAHAELAEAEFRLQQKTATAPKEGVVVDTLYAEGQWVPGGAPVVSIIAPEGVKVRFHVPAHIAATLRHGQEVRLICAQCSSGMRAQVTYVSPIADANGSMSGDSSASPRFLVEAKPRADDVALLRPGSSVQVVL